MIKSVTKNSLHKDQKERWKNMRLMAYISLISGAIFFPFLFIITNATNTANLGLIATPFYSFVTLVITAYMAGSTYGDTRALKTEIGVTEPQVKT